MRISIKIVEKDELVIKWGNGKDELREMIVKLEIREREWIVGMKDVDASGELWVIVIWMNN